MHASLLCTNSGKLRNILTRALALGGLLALGLPAPAADIFWVNPSGGDWMVAANWSSNTVPGPSDRAVLNLNVTISLNAPATVSGLALSNGIFTATSTLTVTTNMDWVAGTLNGTGIVAIGQNATLTLGGGTKSFGQTTINNAGTIRWLSGDIWSGSGATITNRPGALFNIQGDVGWFYNEGGAIPLLLNAGTVQKDSGSGITALGAFLQNDGTFSVQTGTVALSGGGDAHGLFNVYPGATFSFASGSTQLETNSTLNASGTVTFDGGTVNINGSYSVAGSNLVDGATVNFNSSASVHDLGLSSGSLGGSGSLSVPGTLTWTGGSMVGSGTILIPTGATLALAGGVKPIVQHTIDNAGTILWTAGDIWSGSAATITNQPGALFNIKGDPNWQYNEGGATPLLLNGGTIQKTSGSGTTLIGAFLQNDGTLAVQSGTLSLGNGGDAHGLFSVPTGATLSFAGGNSVLETNSSVVATGKVTFSGGSIDLNGAYRNQGSTLLSGATVNFNSVATTRDATFTSGILSGAGSFTISNAMSWTGGQMAGLGATAIAPGATLTLGGGTKVLTQRTLNNAGTILWLSGDLWSGIGATINNLAGALFDLQTDQPWQYNEGGNPPLLNNAGTLQKTAGTGASTFSVVFANSGVVSLQTGTFALNGPSFANQTNGLVQGSGTLDLSHTSVTADGGFSPGSPLGALHVIGSLPQSTSGRINIELGGTTPGVNFDRLLVSGSANLRGALNISLANGFKPSGGDTFEIMTFASSIGTFDNISGLNLSTNFYLEPSFNGTNLVLTAIDNRPRPKFSPAQVQPDGSIHVTLTGIAGQTFVIQASTNFVAWENILTNENAGAVFDFVFPDTAKYRYRFFRTVQQ